MCDTMQDIILVYMVAVLSSLVHQLIDFKSKNKGSYTLLDKDTIVNWALAFILPTLLVVVLFGIYSNQILLFWAVMGYSSHSVFMNVIAHGGYKDILKQPFRE